MQPYISKRILIKIGSDIIGLVEGFATENIREGGIEPNFCSETGQHEMGMYHMTFRIRRWMYVDANKEKLLFNLWNDKTKFMLYFGVYDGGDPTSFLSGTRLILSNCVGYRWRPVTGVANDIVAEELIGEATESFWED